MGERNGEKYPNLGIKLGLDKLWSYFIIKQLGNYGEIYERNIIPLGISRKLNNIVTQGGLLYVPSFR